MANIARPAPTCLPPIPSARIGWHWRGLGWPRKQARLIVSAQSLARQAADAADRPIFVAGSVGPLPSQAQYEALYDEMIAEQVESLIAGGADFILFETQPTRRALEICVAGMRRHRDVDYVLSFALVENCESASGESIEHMMAPLPDEYPQPIAWGMNCGTGPDFLLAAVERAVRLTALPLIVQPNAGMPKEVDNRRIYLCSPEYLAEYAKRYVNLGVSAVGGCCGTTPDHIGELVRTIKPLARIPSKQVLAAVAESVEQKTPAPLAEKSQLAFRLSRRQWVTTVELLPPRGYDLRPPWRRARRSASTALTRSTSPTARGPVPGSLR